MWSCSEIESGSVRVAGEREIYRVISQDTAPLLTFLWPGHIKSQKRNLSSHAWWGIGQALRSSRVFFLHRGCIFRLLHLLLTTAPSGTQCDLQRDRIEIPATATLATCHAISIRRNSYRRQICALAQRAGTQSDICMQLGEKNSW